MAMMAATVAIVECGIWRLCCTKNTHQWCSTSRNGIFKHLDKNQEGGGELVFSIKINTLKFFQNFTD